MSRINDNETFWEVMPETQITPGGFETTTGYTRHKGKSMDNLTAQKLNEMDKHNGMEVADCEDDVWGWVYDCHKEIGNWACGNTHDKRVNIIKDGYGVPELFEDGEPYRILPEDHQPQPTDPIRPNYYQFPSGTEVIDITEHLTGNGAQIVQYVARSTRLDGRNKGDQIENLHKALYFLRREINRIEGDDD